MAKTIVRVSALLPKALHEKLRLAAFKGRTSGNKIIIEALTRFLAATRKGGKR